jgi:WXG100 family type VII secretion target
MGAFMRVSLDHLHEAAKKYEEGSVTIQTVISDIKKSMKALEENWIDANHQTFYEYHKELDQYMHACVEIMQNIAQEMKAIAEGYAKADANQIHETPTHQKGNQQ